MPASSRASADASPRRLGAPSDPVVFFHEWLAQALRACPTAHAMSMATAARDGRTSLRTVLLKAYGRRGFVLLTSADTLKVRQLAENPYVSLLFFWRESHRQVRIDGTAARVPAASLVRSVFSRHDREDRLTWVSPQGRLADIGEALAAGVGDVCCLLVSPRTVSFWQGGTSRRHASLDYERAGDTWIHSMSGPDDLLAGLAGGSGQRREASS